MNARCQAPLSVHVSLVIRRPTRVVQIMFCVQTAQAKMYDEEFGQISQGSLQTLAEDEHDEPLDSADDREEELASSLKTNPGSLAETSLSWIKENSGGHWTEKDGDGGGFDYGGGNTMGRDGNAKGEDSSVDPEEEYGSMHADHGLIADWMGDGWTVDRSDGWPVGPLAGPPVLHSYGLYSYGLHSYGRWPVRRSDGRSVSRSLQRMPCECMYEQGGRLVHVPPVLSARP